MPHATSLAHLVPKVHLHCHLEGTMRPATFVELADKHGVGLRYRPVTAPGPADGGRRDDGRADRSNPYRFEGLNDFLYLFAAVSRSLRDPEDYGRLAREFVEDALAQNVIYGELFVSPPVWTFFNPALDVRVAMEAIVSELRRARPRATFKLLPDLTRNFGAAAALQSVRATVAMGDLDVIGISLGGDERRFPAPLFADAFSHARAQGLHCVAHAGESGDAASVRDAIGILGAQRIGHGIAALHDAAAVELLAERAIPLEICPTSNRRTGTALAGHPHPFIDFDRAGCIVTIDADDPALFGTTIEREYALVEAAAGTDTLLRCVRNAVNASFASHAEKRAMIGRVDAAVAELHSQARG